MIKDDFIKLYEKNARGQCSPEEKRLLESYQDDFRLEELPWNEARMGNKEEAGQAIYEGLRNTVNSRSLTGKRAGMNSNRRGWMSAAAVLILLVGLAAVYLLTGRQTSGQTSVSKAGHEQFKNDIPPGGNKAILTLADGSRIVLDSAKDGELAEQGSTKVQKLGNGQLAYDPGISAGDPNRPEENIRAAISYNTVCTPRGGKYQVLLPDGSKAWLNAASSLRFPTSFTGGERRVELTGEGYFEVVRNAAMPFRVSVLKTGRSGEKEHAEREGGGQTEIEVLGTSFNVMAYSDENIVRTTLLEGAVKIRKGGAAQLLKRGQQAQLQQDGRISLVEKADTEEAVAWKNELFLFENTDIQAAMRQISRWYDVDVRYEGNTTGGFNGQISRTVNVSELLKMLELTGEAHFKIDGRQVTVLP